MHDVLRDRIWRKLDVLPDEQLYQVLDYIEFLETKYARERARRPDRLQEFAERLEDGMRARSVAPKVIRGTVGLFGAARRAAQNIADAGRDLLGNAPPPRAPRPNSGAPPGGASRTDGPQRGADGAGTRDQPEGV